MIGEELLQKLVNAHPGSVDLKPEYRKADGNVDTDKIFDMMIEIAVQLVREVTSKPEVPQAIKEQTDVVLTALDRGDLSKEEFLAGAYTNSAILRELRKRWSQTMMVQPASGSVH